MEYTGLAAAGAILLFLILSLLLRPHSPLFFLLIIYFQLSFSFTPFSQKLIKNHLFVQFFFLQDEKSPIYDMYVYIK